MTTTSQWPGNWSTNKAVFLALADADYFYFVRILIDSLVSLNYSSTDVVVACISKECQRKCMSSGYRCHFIVNKLMENSCGGISRYKYISFSRCLVSTVKIDSILSLLSAGYVVISLDLDVFLLGDPLRAFVPLDQYSLVSMFEDTGTNGNYLNFGFIIVRPSNSTIALFTWMKEEFLHTGKHDQLLLNTFISANNITVQRLDNELFVNYVDTRSKYLAMSGVNHTINAPVVIHTTCVEGAYTKFYLARTLYGRIFNKKMYNGMRTVSSYMQYNLTIYEQASFIDILVNISRQTNRWMRIVGGSHSDILASTFSADKLAHQGIFLVEDTYWESVVEFNHTFIPSTTTIGILPYTDLSLLQYIETDDLILDISTITLQIDPIWKWDIHRPLNQSWLCTLYSERKIIQPFNASCLMQCDGKHF